MKTFYIKKLFPQVALAIVISTTANPLATNTINAEQASNKDLVSARLAITRDIVEVREKLAEYRMSQSFFRTIQDVTTVTSIGATLGCLAGLTHMLLSESMINDIFLIAQDSQDAETNKLAAKSLRVALLTLQGAMSGFMLGVASQSGSLPQISKGQITLVLALQNAIATALAFVADHIGINALENHLRQKVQQDGLIGDIAARVAGRQGLFAYAAKDRPGRARSEFATLTPSLVTAASQTLSLLLVLPEVMIIRSHRKDDGKKQQQLDLSLKELEKMLNEIQNINE